MIDIFIPLVMGVLLLVKPEWFVRKNLDEETAGKKKRFNQKIGWILIGVAVMYFVSRLMIVWAHA